MWQEPGHWGIIWGNTLTLGDSGTCAGHIPGKTPETLQNPALLGALLLKVPPPQAPNVPGAPPPPPHSSGPAGRRFPVGGWGGSSDPAPVLAGRSGAGPLGSGELAHPPSRPLHTPAQPRSPRGGRPGPSPHALRERRDVVERVGQRESAQRQNCDLARQRRDVHSGGAGTPAWFLRGGASGRGVARDPAQLGPALRKGRPRAVTALRGPSLSQWPLPALIASPDSALSPVAVPVAQPVSLSTNARIRCLRMLPLPRPGGHFGLREFVPRASFCTSFFTLRHRHPSLDLDPEGGPF